MVKVSKDSITKEWGWYPFYLPIYNSSPFYTTGGASWHQEVGNPWAAHFLKGTSVVCWENPLLYTHWLELIDWEPLSPIVSLLALSLSFHVFCDHDAMMALSCPPMHLHCMSTSSIAPYLQKISTQLLNICELTPFGTPHFFFPCWLSFSLKSLTVSNSHSSMIAWAWSGMHPIHQWTQGER